MKRFILLSLLLLNVLTGWAQESCRNWAVLKPKNGSGQEAPLCRAVYEIDSISNGRIYAWEGTTYDNIATEDAFIFRNELFKDYEELLCKTYKLYALRQGQFKSGRLDFCPAQDGIFMRTVWGDNAEEPSEFYRIQITREGFTIDKFFYGTLEEAITKPAKEWVKTDKQTLFFVKGDFTGFYNGNALFVEDTIIAKKDILAVRQSLASEKTTLNKLFAKKKKSEDLKRWENVSYNTPIKIIKKREDVVSGPLDSKPSFPGGEEACKQWLAKNVRYPQECVMNGIQGRVIASFIVTKDGSIEDIKILFSPAREMSKEAIRILSKMPKWTPGTLNGEAVSSLHSFPIAFRL